MPKTFHQKKKSFLLFLILVSSLSVVYGQNIEATNNSAYQAINQYKAFLDKTASNNASLLDKKIQKQYLNIINDKNSELIKQLDKKTFLFDDNIQPYLEAIFQHIIDKNLLDKSQFHFFVDRTAAVNAYSFEDGTIVCTLGLLQGMENESQIAMVFCHELAHYLLKHSNIAITNHLEKFNSPVFLAKVRAIKKQEYNIKTQLQNLLENDLFDRSRHSRMQEKAADSLGVLLFSKTNYGDKTVPNIFDFLDNADNKKAGCKISDFFKAEGISLDDLSLNVPLKKVSFGGTIKKETADSLKTHPDCVVRKAEMQLFIVKNPKSGVLYLIDKPERLVKVKKAALFNEALYAKDAGNLGYYLYQLIQLNAIYTSDLHIPKEIYNTLLSINQHYKMHTLFEVVNSPYNTDNNNDEYAKLVKMFDNLSLNRLTEITNTYYQNHKSLITLSNN